MLVFDGGRKLVCRKTNGTISDNNYIEAEKCLKNLVK